MVPSPKQKEVIEKVLSERARLYQSPAATST
jgi:hypothetical protein